MCADEVRRPEVMCADEASLGLDTFLTVIVKVVL